MRHALAPAALPLLAACSLVSAQQPSLRDSQWRLERIDGAPAKSDRAGLRFLPDRISASAGCNGLGGSWKQRGDRIETGPFMSTEMYCEGLMEQEAALGALLGASPKFRLEGDRLVLSGAGHEARFVRKR